jgi:hypothetical protein
MSRIAVTVSASTKSAASCKRKAAPLELESDHAVAEQDRVAESHFKRAKQAGIETAEFEDTPLLDLLFDPTLTLEQFQEATSGLSIRDLCWRDVLEAMDCSRPAHFDFLERLRAFLDEHGGCRADKAIAILSSWELLTCPVRWKAHEDLVELLLTFVHKPQLLHKAVARVRDNKMLRNQRFFSCLMRHLRVVDAAMAHKHESLAAEVWQLTAGSGDTSDSEADAVDAEMLARSEDEDAEVADELASEYSSAAAAESADEDDAAFECDVMRDLAEWLHDRTEISNTSEHRCPAGEARKDYEEWVSQSCHPRQRVGKQEFSKRLEKWYPKVSENGHRFFTGLMLKAAFRTPPKFIGK